MLMINLQCRRLEDDIFCQNQAEKKAFRWLEGLDDFLVFRSYRHIDAQKSSYKYSRSINQGEDKNKQLVLNSAQSRIDSQISSKDLINYEFLMGLYISQQNRTIHIKGLPFIFRVQDSFLQYAVLVGKKTQLGKQIFVFLKQKLSLKKSRLTSINPIRMKNQQKNKFILRSFGFVSSKYNKKLMGNFYQRDWVRKCFFEKLKQAIKKERQINEDRIYHFQRNMYNIITQKDEQVGRQLFHKQIRHKRKFPWTQGMFQEIQYYATHQFNRQNAYNNENNE